MKISGNLRKMNSFKGEVVQYQLPLGERQIELNQLIGSSVRIEYSGKINCIRCGRETGKSFAQGYCFPCFTTAPETEECVLRPELCRAHEGQARDMEYAGEHCLIEHVVYLSLTSGLKVGVTRNTQVPTRWIDQGAVKVIELARTPNRYLAGLVEVSLKEHMDDRTNWRRMLADVDPSSIDMVVAKQRIGELVPEDLKQYLVQGNEITQLSYPVQAYPEKIRSLNFDKDPVVSGKLSGIKGQYLMIDSSEVINIRKFGGYFVDFSAD
jgi:hypothetical protein